MDTLDLLNTIALPGPVEMLDISVDSMFLLVLCEGNQLWLHALATGTLIHNLKGYCSKVMSIALAEDCQRAVVAGVDSRVYIYDIHSGDLDLVPISTAPHHKEVIAVKITNNDDFLVTAGEQQYWVCVCLCVLGVGMVGREKCFDFSSFTSYRYYQAMARSHTGISGKWEAHTQSTNNRRRCPESHTPAPSPVWTYRETAQWLSQVWYIVMSLGFKLFCIF